jgi:hypothetical protein
VGHAFRSTARRQEREPNKQCKRSNKGSEATSMNHNLPMGGHPGMPMLGVGGMVDYNGFGGPLMTGMGPPGMSMMGMHPAMMAGYGGPVVAGMVGGPPMVGPNSIAGMGFPPNGGGGGFNHTQRALLAQEHMLHANRVEAIMQASNTTNGSIPGGVRRGPPGIMGGGMMMNRYGPMGGGGFRNGNMDDVHERMMSGMDSAIGSNRRSYMGPGPGGPNGPWSK